MLRTVGRLLYNARNTHLGVQAFSKPVFKIATLEWVSRFFTAMWSSNYFGLPHDCEGQGYVLLWVVRKTQFLIGEVLAMISTAVKLQTTNVLSLEHSILSEPCNVNLYGLMQHTTCFTTWAKANFLPYTFVFSIPVHISNIACSVIICHNIWKCKKLQLVATVVIFINKICTCPTMVGGSLSGVIAV